MAEAGYSNDQNMIVAAMKLSRATERAKIGLVIYDTVTQLNVVIAKFNLFLAHVDTGNVAGIGNTNAATYGTAVAVKLPSQR